MDEWFGNTEDVRKKHYLSTSDTSEARKQLAVGQNPKQVGHRLGSENAQESTQELICEALSSF